MTKPAALVAILLGACASEPPPDTDDINGTWDFLFGIDRVCAGQQREQVQIAPDADPLFANHEPTFSVNTSIESVGSVYEIRVVDSEDDFIRSLVITLQVGETPTASVVGGAGPFYENCAFRGNAIVEKLSDDGIL